MVRARRAIGAVDSYPLSVRRFAPAIKRLQRTVIHASKLARPPAADPQPCWALRFAWSREMERDELVRILREALNPASDNAVRARESASKLPPDIADALFIHTISRPIEAVLAKSEPFDGGGFLVQQG